VALRNQLKYRRDHARLLEADLAVALQQVEVLRAELRHAEDRLRTEAMRLEVERLSCPSLLERNTGLYVGLGGVLGTDGEVSGGAALLFGFKLGRWR